MDIGPDPRDFQHLTQLRPAEDGHAGDPWAEHGWGLTGWQTCQILLVIGVACLLLKAAGG